MPRKQLNYEEWIRTRALVEARAKRILAYFDLGRLRRVRKGPEEGKKGGGRSPRAERAKG